MKFLLIISAVLIFGALGVKGQDLGSVEGNVEMGGLPVADATVTAAKDGDPNVKYTAQTRGDGTYRLPVPLRPPRRNRAARVRSSPPSVWT